MATHCSYCDGTGERQTNSERTGPASTCSHCGGSGKVGPVKKSVPAEPSQEEAIKKAKAKLAPIYGDINKALTPHAGKALTPGEATQVTQGLVGSKHNIKDIHEALTTMSNSAKQVFGDKQPPNTIRRIPPVKKSMMDEDKRDWSQDPRPKRGQCPDCKGRGHTAGPQGQNFRKCGTCDGSGHDQEGPPIKKSAEEKYERCPSCYGKGTRFSGPSGGVVDKSKVGPRGKCGMCGGSGTVEKEKEEDAIKKGASMKCSKCGCSCKSKGKKEEPIKAGAFDQPRELHKDEDLGHEEWTGHKPGSTPKPPKVGDGEKKKLPGSSVKDRLKFAARGMRPIHIDRSPDEATEDARESYRGPRPQ